jgi:hypothetical protein
MMESGEWRVLLGASHLDRQGRSHSTLQHVKRTAILDAELSERSSQRRRWCTSRAAYRCPTPTQRVWHGERIPHCDGGLLVVSVE